MTLNIPDHPDIASALRTGYPTFGKDISHYCEECGCCLDDRNMYSDSAHDYLCKDCLLTLHEKHWW